jgi:hypothetical protein
MATEHHIRRQQFNIQVLQHISTSYIDRAEGLWGGAGGGGGKQL